MELSSRLAYSLLAVLFLVAVVTCVAIVCRDARYVEYKIPHLPHYVPSCMAIAVRPVDPEWPPVKLDGVVLFEGHRVLLASQDMKTDNGVYVLTGDKKLVRSQDTLRNHSRIYVDSKKTTYVIAYDRSIAPNQEGYPGIDVVAGSHILLDINRRDDDQKVLNDRFQWTNRLLEDHAWTISKDRMTLLAPKSFACLSQCQVRLTNNQFIRVLDSGSKEPLISSIPSITSKKGKREIQFDSPIETISIL